MTQPTTHRLVCYLRITRPRCRTRPGGSGLVATSHARFPLCAQRYCDFSAHLTILWPLTMLLRTVRQHCPPRLRQQLQTRTVTCQTPRTQIRPMVTPLARLFTLSALRRLRKARSVPLVKSGAHMPRARTADVDLLRIGIPLGSDDALGKSAFRTSSRGMASILPISLSEISSKLARSPETSSGRTLPGLYRASIR